MPNDKAFRSAHRLTAYVDKKVKKRVILECRKSNRTPSREIDYALKKYYGIS